MSGTAVNATDTINPDAIDPDFEVEAEADNPVEE